jgi:Carboxypeptidase regulatory-like domain
MEESMKRLAVAATFALVGLTCGCGRSASAPLPMAPSPAALAPSPVPPAVSLTLNGYVGDTAFRPLAGVRVEVLNGPDAGMELTSEANGHFSYTGTFPGTVSMRASKDGFIAATQPVFPSTTSAVAWVSFQLAPLAPPVSVAGNYTLTIIADSACAGVPEDVRTRTYAATVTVNSRSSAPANTSFNGSVTGARFAPYANIFWVGVAGDYLALSTEGEGPSIVEEVGPNRYIAYSASAGASIGTAGVTTLSAAFNGLIEYCELKSPIGSYYDCSPSLAAVREQCTSTNNRLILTRR